MDHYPEITVLPDPEFSATTFVESISGSSGSSNRRYIEIDISRMKDYHAKSCV
jgi:hypothetical protein